MAKLKRSNPKAFETLALRIKELDGFTAKVGWFESAKYENGTPVAYVAAIQEMGHAPIPPRPFMRPAAIAKANDWRETAAAGAKSILAGKHTGKQVMMAIGEQAQGDILQTITDVVTPPLSELTLAIRKYKMLHPDRPITGKKVGQIARMLRENEIDISGVSTKPLNDSGLMIATLTNLVEESK